MICICVALMALGVGGGEGSWVESPHVVRAANQSAAIPEGSSLRRNTYMHKHISQGGDERRQPRSGEQASEHFSSVTPCGIRIYGLQAEWLVQVQSEEKRSALLCRCNILLGNKHPPGRQCKQLLLFKAVLFKGDELEWPECCYQAGGFEVIHIIYGNCGLDKMNSFHVILTEC